MKIGDIMNTELMFLTPDNTIEEAMGIILHHCRTGLPVVDDDKQVIRFISEEDIIKKILPDYAIKLKSFAFLPDYGQFAKRFAVNRNMKVGEIMQKKVITFNVDDSDFAAASEMLKKHIKLAPVIDNKGTYVGCISRAFLIRSMMRIESHEERKKPRYE